MGRLCVTEVHAVVQDWKARGVLQYVDGITSISSESEGGGGGFDGGEELDALFDQAVNFVTRSVKRPFPAFSVRFTSAITRAARIIEQMEAQVLLALRGVTVIVKCWLRRLLGKPVSRMALQRHAGQQNSSIFLLSSC